MSEALVYQLLGLLFAVGALACSVAGYWILAIVCVMAAWRLSNMALEVEP